MYLKITILPTSTGSDMCIDCSPGFSANKTKVGNKELNVIECIPNDHVSLFDFYSFICII